MAMDDNDKDNAHAIQLASQNDFLRMYLTYVEKTESPRIMHVWSVLSAASACMGRHVWLPLDLGNLFANMYVLLVGPPGTRKSTAIRIPNDIAKVCTGIRYAPDDTSGQRQGLITAMGVDELAEVESEFAGVDFDSIIKGTSKLTAATVRDEDKHCLYASASEFGSFIGQNSLDMTRFLIKVWDGEDYTYQLKRSRAVLHNPLLGLIGGTTPSDIARIMPQDAIGQGFMSRIILVFAPKRYKKIPPRDSVLSVGIESAIKDVFKWLWNDLYGAMKLSPAAADMEYQLYGKEVNFNDVRFLYYLERRYTHLMKLAMVLTALCQRTMIEEGDLALADALLSATERNMPDALGEYGLSPLAMAKQKMIDFIRSSQGPVPDNILWAMMQRDMRMIDFRNATSDLMNAGKIAHVDTHMGKAFVYKESLSDIDDVDDEDEQDEATANGFRN